eukprot:496238_1
MEEFEEVWQQYKQEYTSNSEQLESLIRIIPTINNSQRDEYEEQGEECLRNIERSIADLNQSLRENRSLTGKDKYRQQLNVYKQQLKSQKSNFSEALQKQRY